MKLCLVQEVVSSAGAPVPMSMRCLSCSYMSRSTRQSSTPSIPSDVPSSAAALLDPMPLVEHPATPLHLAHPSPPPLSPVDVAGQNLARDPWSSPPTASEMAALDLVYVTPNLIAMGFPLDKRPQPPAPPGEGVSGAGGAGARTPRGGGRASGGGGGQQPPPGVQNGNNIDLVAAVLRGKHAGHYMVWNVSEEGYDYSLFEEQASDASGWARGRSYRPFPRWRSRSRKGARAPVAGCGGVGQRRLAVPTALCSQGEMFLLPGVGSRGTEPLRQPPENDWRVALWRGMSARADPRWPCRFKVAASSFLRVLGRRSFDGP